MTSKRDRRAASTWFLALVALAAAPGAAVVGDEKDRPEGRWVESSREEPAGTHYRTFRSEAVGGEVSYLVYLPPRYGEEKDRHYPVVYWLYGLGSDQRGGAGFVRRLDEAIRHDRAPAMIAVLVNGPPASFFVDSPRGKSPAEEVIVKDLVPHVDATYRTIPRRRARAVEGFSMGGFGAGHLGFKHPGTFGLVSILAGALDQAEEFAEEHPAPFREVFGGDKAYLKANSPWTLLEENADAIRKQVRVRVVTGKEDGIHGGSERLHERLGKLDIEHEYDAVPGVGHDYKKLYDKLGDDGFRFYDRAWGKLDGAGD